MPFLCSINPEWIHDNLHCVSADDWSECLVSVIDASSKLSPEIQRSASMQIELLFGVSIQEVRQLPTNLQSIDFTTYMIQTLHILLKKHSFALKCYLSLFEMNEITHYAHTFSKFSLDLELIHATSRDTPEKYIIYGTPSESLPDFRYFVPHYQCSVPLVAPPSCPVEPSLLADDSNWC